MFTRPTIAMIRPLFRDERGNALAILAFALPVVLGCAGLAVDTIQWVGTKRELQGAADAAAIAGVYGLIQADDMEGAVDRSLSTNKDLDPTRSVSAQQSPEARSGDPFAVRVRIASPARLSFSSLFLRSRPVISVEATATVVEAGEFCAFALGSGDETGVLVKSGADVEMDCSIAANSSSKEAVKAEGSALSATRVVAFGGVAADGIKSAVRGYGLKQKDPLADTEPPLVPNTGCPNITVNPDAAAQSGGRVVLEPGCYGNMTLNGPVFLQDGEYILNRGNMVVGPTAELSCKSCTIFLTSDLAAEAPQSIGKVSIDGHAKVQMSAPEQGPNAGILFYQDRHAEGDPDRIENMIGGNSFSKLKGLLYFPSGILRLDGRMSPDFACARLVGRRLLFDGRIVIAKDCGASGLMKFQGTDVRLVG